jgi:hypothetical protein
MPIPRGKSNAIEVPDGYRKPIKGEDPLAAFPRKSVSPRAGYYVDGGSSPFATESTRLIREILNGSDLSVDVADVLAKAFRDPTNRRNILTHGLVVPVERKHGLWGRASARLRHIARVAMWGVEKK